jgi:hypothetical protein
MKIYFWTSQFVDRGCILCPLNDGSIASDWVLHKMRTFLCVNEHKAYDVDTFLGVL